ncbi:Flavodoxin [Carpediemonas membranifera]|uniref:Flavodoxin n=1 Tax=Carpediemonas membranifera TaxID=201153 RepID=A0A8J6BDD6_9EUKA|nr:Flavodoxin [Carpediemonas membranifera]|eukprot:KAG9395157.1 Flavodoxin [Carpediemonas membranifera]
METATKQRHSVLIGYGSSTGQAADCADIVADSIAADGYKAVVRELNDIPRHEPFIRQFSLFVIIISSSDDTDDHVPFNAEVFCHWLQTRPDLAGVDVALFGLGDSSYTTFNAAGNLLEELLLNAGCLFVCPVGVADDEEGSVFEQLEPWVATLTRAVRIIVPGSPPVIAQLPGSTMDVA